MYQLFGRQKAAPGRLWENPADRAELRLCLLALIVSGAAARIRPVHEKRRTAERVVEVLLSKYRPGNARHILLFFLFVYILLYIYLSLSRARSFSLCTGRRSVFHFRLSMYRSRWSGLAASLTTSFRAPLPLSPSPDPPRRRLSHLSSFMRIVSLARVRRLLLREHRRATSSRRSSILSRKLRE